MSFTMEDNLESDGSLSAECKFAITCHNRTVQRRSFGRDPLFEDKVSRSPSKGAREAVGKGYSSTNKLVMETKPSPIKIQPVLKSAESPMSPDTDVMKSLREDPLSSSLDSLDLEELDSLSREDCSWAGLFSFQDLRAIHQQLCMEPGGMWTVLFGSAEVPETEMDELCHSLQMYLGHALDTCGWKICQPERAEAVGYEESLNRATNTARGESLQEKHKTIESMVDLLELYEEEDHAYGGLLEASTQLYQYLLQPFRDMRELAMLRRQQIKIYSSKCNLIKAWRLKMELSVLSFKKTLSQTVKGQRLKL
uniref:Uncharacterized protein n=1 Tax=Labrus bergylta TaxID=56723 RepID=A0A3Q3EDB7_9LABR